VAIATAGGVYTSINGLGQSLHPSSWSLRPDASCICNGHTPGALYVKQTAVYKCKRLGDSELCNATCCETISWSSSLADNRDLLEHHYAAKQHLVHSIRGMHKEALERGLLKQLPTLDIARSNRYQVGAQVDQVKSHFIQSGRDNIAGLYDTHRIESATEHLEFIHYLLADSYNLSPVAECVEGGVRGPNRMPRESEASNEWLASTLLPGGSNPAVYLHENFIIGRITTVSMLIHIIIPWLMTRTVIYRRPWSSLAALHCATLPWCGNRTKVFIRKLPSQSWNQTDLIARTTSTTRLTVVRSHPTEMQWIVSC